MSYRVWELCSRHDENVAFVVKEEVVCAECHQSRTVEQARFNTKSKHGIFSQCSRSVEMREYSMLGTATAVAAALSDVCDYLVEKGIVK